VVELAVFFFSLAEDFSIFLLVAVPSLQGGTAADVVLKAELNVLGVGPLIGTIDQVLEIHQPFMGRLWVETRK
jgi:hypothetical protein